MLDTLRYVAALAAVATTSPALPHNGSAQHEHSTRSSAKAHAAAPSAKDVR
jgi:hypothetical protein